MDTNVIIDPLIIAILVGTVTPLITGLIVKLNASKGVKGLVAVLLVVVGSVINFVVEHRSGFAVREFILFFAATLVMHVSTYYGIWKPLGGGEGAPTMTSTPDLGIGGTKTATNA